MALPDYFKDGLGTPVIWGEAGATGISLTVTKTLSVDALAAGTAWMGAYADLGATWDRDQLLQVIIETAATPTALATAEVYLAWSHDATNWPGLVDGTSKIFPATPTSLANNLRQLGNPSAIFTAIASASVQRGNPVVIRARARYVAPVLSLNTGLSCKDESTASDNDTRIVLTPIISSVAD